MTQHIIEGSDNIFSDLNIEQADLQKAKADLAIEIEKIIKNRKLTQAQAAKLIGAKQPDISNLKNGQLKGFTFERLMLFLIRLNRDIKLSVKRVPRKSRRGFLETEFLDKKKVA